MGGLPLIVVATSYVREAIRAALPLGINEAGNIVPIASAG
jgi:hypothetical protein